MQCHFANAHGTAANLATTLNKFKEQDYEIQITELDITNQGTVTETTTDEEKAEINKKVADSYYDIMTELIKAKKNGANIRAIVIWGLTDVTSWRAESLPLLFGTDVSDVKEAFHKVIKAAEDASK